LEELALNHSNDESDVSIELSTETFIKSANNCLHSDADRSIGIKKNVSKTEINFPAIRSKKERQAPD